MRYPTEDSVGGLFAGDIPQGGTLIKCSECETMTDSHEPWGEPLYCQNCKKELHYHPHCEW